MFELWPLSLFLFIVAFIVFLILKHGKDTGSMFVGIFYPNISKKQHPDYFDIWVIMRCFSIIMLVAFGIIFLVMTPDMPQKEKMLTAEELSEQVIGNWKSMGFVKGLKISIYSNNTFKAVYNNTIYMGTWKAKNNNYIYFNWKDDLKLLHPLHEIIEDKFFTIDSAHYINGGLSILSGQLIGG